MGGHQGALGKLGVDAAREVAHRLHHVCSQLLVHRFQVHLPRVDGLGRRVVCCSGDVLHHKPKLLDASPGIFKEPGGIKSRSRIC